jgi:UDP-glucose 4-epimerase
MKNILVTGAAGYIGSHTCVELLKRDFNVITVDNYSNSSWESLKRVEKIAEKKMLSYRCDVRDSFELSRVFSKNNIDAVIHFAALKAVAESCRQPLVYYDNNICGIVNLLKIMDKFRVKKMIFSSSATVYAGNKVPYTEEMKLSSLTNPYGRTKYFAEQILHDLYNSDNSWNIVILRYFNPIGAHKSGLIGEEPLGVPNNIMPIILRVASGRLPKLTIFGNDYNTPDGTCIRDYIHVVDVAAGHIAAMDKFGTKSGFIDIFNLGTGEGHSVLELVSIFEKISGRNIRYEFGSKREGDMDICCADVKKAKEILNWKTRYNLERMCKDAWHWQHTNPFR